MKVCPKCSLRYDDEVTMCKCGYKFQLSNETYSNEIKNESVKEIEANIAVPPITLSAWSIVKGFHKSRIYGFRKKLIQVEWTISLGGKNAEFRAKVKGEGIMDRSMVTVINVPRPGSDQRIHFPNQKFDFEFDKVRDSEIWAEGKDCLANLTVIEVMYETVTVGFLGVTIPGTTKMVMGIKPEDQYKLKTWVVPLTVKEVKNEIREFKNEIRGWAIPLILIGVAHLIFRNFLNPIWGIVLIVLGIVNLAIPVPAMVIVNGLALIVVGISNIFTICATGNHYWAMLGLFQIGLGVSEIGKYKRYSRSVKKI